MSKLEFKSQALMFPAANINQVFQLLEFPSLV